MVAKLKVYLFFVSLFLFACSKSNENLQKELLNAANSIQSGQITNALEALEELSNQYPENLEVVKLTAIANQRISNYADAAFYFDIAATMDYGDPKLFKYAGENFVQANDHSSARSSFFNYLKSYPDDVDVWLKFADVLSIRDEHKKALDAYLKGLELLQTPPTSDHQTKLGQLFLKVQNYAQAEYRFREALKDKSAYSLPALLGLLEVQKANKSWYDANATVQRLENEYPGTLDSTSLASVKNDIANWDAEQKKNVEIPASEAIITQKSTIAPLKVPTVFKKLNMEKSEDTNLADSIVPTEYPIEHSKKLEVEAIASTQKENNQKLSESFNDNTESTVTPAQTSSIIESVSESRDQEPSTDLVSEKSVPKNKIQIGEDEEKAEQAVVLARLEEPELSLQEKQELEFVDKGNQFILSKNYTQAIATLWKALGLNSQNAKTWYLLSRAYLLSGEMENAEMTIMEAVRNDDENLSYRIEYLKLMKKMQPPEKYLNELLKSKEDFPDDPTITLSLASAFSTIRKKPRVSILLYQEFLEKHPEHPLADRVKSRLEKLTAGT